MVYLASTEKRFAVMSRSMLRFFVEAATILTVYVITVFSVWDSGEWKELFETMFLHVHFALLVFEVGAMRVSVLDNFTRVEETILSTAAGLCLWACLADALLITLASRDVNEKGSSGEYVAKLVVAVVVMALDMWRYTEIVCAVPGSDCRLSSIHSSYRMVPFTTHDEEGYTMDDMQRLMDKKRKAKEYEGGETPHDYQLEPLTGEPGSERTDLRNRVGGKCFDCGLEGRGLRVDPEAVHHELLGKVNFCTRHGGIINSRTS